MTRMRVTVRLFAMLRAARFEPLERWGDPFSVHVLARPI